ncbi:MAG: class I SAM-dependent methyltransferase [Kiritimatiellae bacterium]|nr:class I SAM-dependent methyltransferase [Kiritimatiellia bacterium]
MGYRIKLREESNFWQGLYNEIIKNCSTPEERRVALLRNCYDDSFERYKRFLNVRDDSFTGMKVLDVGCGPTCGLIGFKNCEKYGLDHLLDVYRMIGFPLNEHGVTYINARGEDTGLPEGEFDRILCVNALDHVDNLKKCIREFSRLLKNGGELLAQIGFHEKPTETEPIVMRHDVLLRYARINGLQPLEIKLVDQSSYLNEYRYYYRFRKLS